MSATARHLLLCVGLWAACKGSVGGAGSTGRSQLLASLGEPLATGPAVDLRITRDGRFASYLMASEKPRLEGLPPQMVLGTLYAVGTRGPGAPRQLGQGVTNMPGGYIFSADSRWVLYLTGYNAANHSGELHAADLTSASGPLNLGAGVTYMLASPDSKTLAFVSNGVLKVGPIAGPFEDISGEVATAHFAPDSSYVLFRRRITAAAGLFIAPVGKAAAPRRLGERVGDFAISPDSRRIAFMVAGDVTPGLYDLHVTTPDPSAKALKVATGVGSLQFSPDSKWLARKQGLRLENLGIGDLYVGPSEGGSGHKVGEKVQDYAFSPDSSAVASLELFDPSFRKGAGVLGLAALPEGRTRRVGNRVANFQWAPDSKSIAFLSHIVRPMPSVNLMFLPLTDEKATSVFAGAFGYDYTPSSDRVLFHAACVREGRACDLMALDTAKPKEPPRKLLEGVFNFHVSPGGDRILVTYARTASSNFDIAIDELSTGKRKTIDQEVALPAYFAAEDGSRVVYIVAERSRPGVYVADHLP